MDITSDITIVIPLRTDFPERALNLNAVINFFLTYTQSKIIILEAGSKRLFSVEENNQLRYIFIKDDDPIFHRTRYLNKLINMADTPLVGIWDTDVLVPLNQILSSANDIMDGAVMSFPYDGKFIYLDNYKSIGARKDFISFLQQEYNEEDYLLMSDSVGGAFLVDKEKYLNAGGENELFYGWGPEDIERVKRLEILELPVRRASGKLYHLYHPRGINSLGGNDLREINNIKALLDICGMNKEQMLNYLTRQ